MYPEDNVQKTTAPTASDLLLGRGVRFEGKLTFAGTVRIDASFVGTIVTDDVLVVGEAARIDANITCGTIVVHGEVNGNIQAKAGVEIRAADLQMLLDGVDLDSVKRRQRYRRPRPA